MRVILMPMFPCLATHTTLGRLGGITMTRASEDCGGWLTATEPHALEACFRTWSGHSPPLEAGICRARRD